MGECRDWLASSQKLSVPQDECATDWEFFREELRRFGGGVFPVGNGRYYLVWIPEIWDTIVDRKVIVSVHGTGGCAEWMLNEWYQATEHDWALVSLQYYDRSADRYDDDEVIYENLENVVEELRHNCPVSEADFFYHGFSRGSAQGFAVAIRDRAASQLFTSFIADSGNSSVTYPTLKDAPHDAMAGARFWMWCGEHDISAVDPLRTTCEIMSEDTVPYIASHGGTVDAFTQEADGCHGMFHYNCNEKCKKCDGRDSDNLGPSLPVLFDYISGFYPLG